MATIPRHRPNTRSPSTGTGCPAPRNAVFRPHRASTSPAQGRFHAPYVGGALRSAAASSRSRHGHGGSAVGVARSPAVADRAQPPPPVRPGGSLHVDHRDGRLAELLVEPAY